MTCYVHRNLWYLDFTLRICRILFEELNFAIIPLLFISRFAPWIVARPYYSIWHATSNSNSLHHSNFSNSRAKSLADDLVINRWSLIFSLICRVYSESLTILALWKSILTVSRTTCRAFTVVMLWYLIPLTIRIRIIDLCVLEVNGLCHSTNSSSN